MRPLRETFALSKKLAALAALAALGFVPARADVQSLVDEGKITWTGAEESWANDELILTFTDTATPGTLTIADTVKASARILTVGGGGAGGTSKSTDAGAGGGGGAGGFLELTGYALSGGTYTATVGAGGSKAAEETTLAEGEDGGDSVFSKDGGGEIAHVYGGGGGGAESAGHDGGSGGGASYNGSKRAEGGEPKPKDATQGKKGGYGNTTQFGGGGGGADGEGGRAGSSYSKGGDGVKTDIGGFEQKVYAAGGGGGRTKGTAQRAGGSNNVGGKGGSVEAEAEDGMANTGSGGGGGGLVGVGGAGADGVVIVRITEAIEIYITTPEGQNFTFDGETHTGVAESVAYTLGGDVDKSDVGEYRTSVTPNDGFTWKDAEEGHETETRYVDWTISPASVEIPAAPGAFAYNGLEQKAIEEGAGYVLSGDWSATNAGGYTYTATLADSANSHWSDGTTEPKTFSWSIAPVAVDVPAAPTGLVYTGENQVAFEVGEHYHFTEASVTNATGAGTYPYEIVLDNPADATNYVWNVSPQSSENRSGSWTIAKAANECSVSLEGWKVGETPETPVGTATWGLDTAAYTYASSPTAAETEWTAEAPATAGQWYVKMTIPEAENWLGATATASFVLWESPADVFRNSITYIVRESGVKPTAFWQSGEFADDAGKHGGYAITLNTGNTINDAGNIVIGDTATKGAGISIASAGKTKASILVKYKAPAGGAPAANSVLAGVVATDNHPIGAFCQTAGGTSMEGYWLNGTTAATGYSFKTPPPAVEGGSGYFLFCYHSDASSATVTDGTAFYAGDSIGNLVGGNVAGLQWRGHTINELSIGGPASGVTVPWKGLEIESVALFVDAWLTPDDITMKNFQIPVRISEDKSKGLVYSELGKDGTKLAFVGEDGSLLAYDVDTWNVSGESVVWVNLPTAAVGTKFTMYWNIRDGQIAPGPKPEKVWADYAGVWHFNETITSATAAATVSKDSTGNGLDAVPTRGTNTGDQRTQMASTSGVFGNARVNSTGMYTGGNRLVVDNSGDLELGSVFMFSGWVKVGGINGSNIIVSRKEGSNDNNGWQLGLWGSTAAGSLAVWGPGGSPVRPEVSSTSLASLGDYFYVTVVYNGSNLVVMYNDSYYNTYSGRTAVADNGLPLAFGGGSGNGSQLVFNGSYDEFRIRKGLVETDMAKLRDRTRAEYAAATSDSFLSRGLVERNGKLVNYWVREPSITPTNWDVGEDPADVALDIGELFAGTVTNWIYEVNAPTNIYLKISEIPEDRTGVFRAVSRPVETNLYEDLAFEVTFRINAHSPYSNIQGTNGDSGRILLMNRDRNTACPIDRQGYNDRSASQVTYWEFLNADGADLPFNLKEGTESILHKRGGDRLWHLIDCRHGNTYPKDVETTGADLSGDQNYLPWSDSSSSILSRLDPVTQDTVGQIVMRNVEDAAVYSQCFTNGVGTIYFDAVNGWTDGATETGENYKLVVEVATNALMYGESVLPTDENSWDETDGVTNYYANLEDTWHKVNVIPYLRDGTDGFARLDPTNVLALAVKNGKTMKNFYRVVVPFNDLGNEVYGKASHLRFRIRRTKALSNYDPDQNYMILLDNIIVSYPPMRAELGTAGFYDAGDAAKRGKTMMGYELSTSTPYPAAGDATLKGRAKAAYIVNEGNPLADTTAFVAAAQMWYRWRYLQQRFGDWKYVDLDPMTFESAQTLDLPSVAGDVEYYYTAQLQAPFYKYVDYSGTNLGVPYSEEVTDVTNRLDSATILPTTGTDWFFRLRKGASEWEGVSVVAQGALTNEYPMALIEDDMWRALIVIPTNAEGNCTFSFKGVNKLTGSPWEIKENVTNWGVADSADASFTPPGNGLLREGGDPLSFEVDHISNYLEVKISTRYLTWSVARAEYQDFNHWNDAHTPAENPQFKVNVPTNGVDDVAMKTYPLADDIKTWSEFSSGNKDWDETFTLSNYNDPGFPKEIVYQSHVTPARWDGYNLSFVSTELTGSSSDDQMKKSGMGAKLIGRGNGSLVYTKANCPKGLEKVSLRARLGQSMTFDGISWNPLASTKSNYVFFTPAIMSRKCSDSALGDTAVGAAVSVVGYYRPSAGCYEFRAERLYSGANMRLSLYKWTLNRGTMEPTLLCAQDFSSRKLWPNNDDSTKSADVKLYYGMFISLENTSAGTKIICGLSANGKAVVSANPVSNFSGDSGGFGGLVYTDTSSYFTRGSYGVMAKDCPAEFMAPVCYKTAFTSGITTGGNASMGLGGQYFNPSQNNLTFGDESTYDDLRDSLRADEWELVAGRAQCYTNKLENYDAAFFVGIRTPTDIKQTVELWLKSKTASGANWVKYGEKEVSSYGFTSSFDMPLNITGTWDIKLTTGGYNADVVVDDVKQYQWQAPDLDGLEAYSGRFIYTQGVVETNKTLKARQLVLQPSRGVATRAMSLRSPILGGLGRVAFSYENVDANAEIWVQVATNSVNGATLSGATGYNNSVDSVDYADVAAGTATEPVGTWITLAKYTAADLGTSGSKPVYLGWHNNEADSVRGVFRLYVPTNVVSAAIIAATNETQNTAYGRITITGMTVTDEPALSDRAWRGWNIRTIGDGADTERRMNIDDSSLLGEDGTGLDCGLNNSTDDVVPVDEIVKVESGNPAIYSPTFKSYGQKRGVGAVTFSARLYSTNNTPVTAGAGLVTLYGSTSSTSERWEKITDFKIDSSVFADYAWTASNQTYAAVKLEVPTISGEYDRVILDEVTVSEKVQPSLSFVYATPFRQNLMSSEPIADIDSPSEQPLAGESWGVQAKLALRQLADEIDLEKGVTVTLAYYSADSYDGRPPAVWGYGNWESIAKANGNYAIPLKQVGDPADLVFRSVGDSPESLVQPSSRGGVVVQYQLTATFYGRDGTEYTQTVDNWEQPDWYYPIDHNKASGATDPASPSYSPYTILDSVSPGRAWINEVNWNDGKGADNDNQFIEVCVPAGIDMTGWYIRLNDGNKNHNPWIMATFGYGSIQGSAQRSEKGTNGYEFVVLQSPNTSMNSGGIRDTFDGQVLNAPAWYSDGIDGSAPNGELNYGYPFQFELVRPSGVIEHQFVLQGTNQWSGTDYEYYSSGEYLTSQLQTTDGSPLRFYAGEEKDVREGGDPYGFDNRTFGSSGVTGDGETPGATNSWKSAMMFTPGRLNEGQTIPENWFLRPNGTNAWVYLMVEGGHISQNVGGNTDRSVMIVVPQGSQTNVTYSATPWYEVACIDTDGDKVYHHTPGEWVYSFTPTQQTSYITAHEGPVEKLVSEFGLKESNPYTPAVINWLAEKYPDKTPEDINAAIYKGLAEDSAEQPLTLTEMYWLDINPFGAERQWWLRGNFVQNHGGGTLTITNRTYTNLAGETIVHTNRILTAKLYISNAVDKVAHAPYRLQGLANEKSDEFYGSWTSVTFQVTAMLLTDMPRNKGFLTFRPFIFDENSFYPAGDEHEFESTIEILDPFSKASPGYGYGWSDRPDLDKDDGSLWRWEIGTTNTFPVQVERLKMDSTYD